MAELKSIPLWQWRLVARFAHWVEVRPDSTGRYVMTAHLPLAGFCQPVGKDGRAMRFDTFEAACAFAHRFGIRTVLVPTDVVARLNTARELTQSILSDIRGGLL